MTSPLASTFAFGRFRLEGLDGRLTLDGKELQMPARERRLLSMLVEHPDQWLREEWLARALWPKAVPPKEELEHLVRELSAKLEGGADGVATIQALGGRGYRLAIPVRTIAPAVAEKPAVARVAKSEQVDVPVEAGSARRRIIAPGRFAILLLAAAVAASLLAIGLRRATRTAESVPLSRLNDDDPMAVRAAASAELAKGVAASRGHSASAIEEAVGRFESSKAIEPGFAQARAGLARALVRRGDLARAKREAEVALVLEPDLAEAHAALAFTRLFADWNPDAARESAERAIALDAVQVASRRALALSLAAQGRFAEAIDEIGRARALGEPDPELATDEARIQFLAKETVEARRIAAREIRNEPTLASMRALLAEIHLTERRLGPAELELELRDRLLAGATAADERIRMSNIGGWEPPDPGEAARLLRARAEASAAGGASAPRAQIEAARIFAQFGDIEPGLAALERAVTRREGDVVFSWVDPGLAPLRATSRFRELMTRAGIAAPAPAAPAASGGKPTAPRASRR